MTKEINPTIAARLKAASELVLHEPPLFKALEMKPTVIDRGRMTYSARLHKDFTAANGNIHPSLLTLVMDTVFGTCVFTRLEALKSVATINLRTDYLLPAKPGSKVLCTAECKAIRGEIAYISGGVFDAETNAALAAGSGAFMIGTRGARKDAQP